MVIAALILSFLSLSTASVSAAGQDEWWNWCGPNGNGSISIGKYPIKWDAEHVLWKVALPGKGTSTPLVRDQRIYLTAPADGEDAVLAFDFSGKQIWERKLGPASPPKHRTLGSSCNASPVTDGMGLFLYHEGKPALLVWGADHLSGHDAANAQVLWSCDGFNPEATGFWPAIATPVIAGNVAVVPVGRDDRARQARIHGIKIGGKGDVSESHRAWKREDLGVFVATPAEYKGRVFLLRHRGGLVCLDPGSGQTLWSGAFPAHRSTYYSSPIIANGLLYAAREDGTVFVARVEEKFELLGENPMGERIIASPVPVANRLFLRGDRHLFCVAGE
jgi:outer membrane protein assembly factor BamB